MLQRKKAMATVRSRVVTATGLVLGGVVQRASGLFMLKHTSLTFTFVVNSTVI